MDDLQEAFDLYDSDGSGSISTDEVNSLFKCFQVKKSKQEVKELV